MWFDRDSLPPVPVLSGAAVLGAPHSFFDRRFEDFADASEDAWRRVLAFVAQHTGPKR